MFAPERLAKLSPVHRLRKAALLLEGLEKAALESGAWSDRSIEEARRIARTLHTLRDTPFVVLEAAARVEASFPDASETELDRNAKASKPTLRSSPLLRAIDSLRHVLLREGGQARADWDLLDPLLGSGLATRRPFPGMCAYLEDIRSPFNVGSMFRTAEALGLGELILSPACAAPEHPRAARSAMGAVELLPWRRGGLEELKASSPSFALELGGTPLDRFDFPERGIVVVGSEELGVSREALQRCTMGSVSIPMRGAKASLNVGVAFGILLQEWASRIDAHS